MRPGDDSQDGATELRVTDRRRFTAEGEIRDASDDESDAPRRATGPAPPSAPAPPAPAGPEAMSSARTDGEPRLPPATAAGGVFDLGIEAVFYVFYQSALIALGASAPDGPPPRIDLAEARQAITFLQALEEKTRGNLTADESATLRELLGEAKMAYVQVARSVAGGGP